MSSPSKKPTRPVKREKPKPQTNTPRPSRKRSTDGTGPKEKK